MVDKYSGMEFIFFTAETAEEYAESAEDEFIMLLLI